MATKKAGSAKKSVKAPSKSVKTTVKAVEAKKSSKKALFDFGDRRTVLAAALIGEFIGTFVLASAFLVTRGEPLYLSFAAVGVVLMVGTLSGAYLNPALTVGAWVTRKIGHLRAVSYVVAQVLGAAAAFMLLNTYMNANTPETAANAFQAQQSQVFQVSPLTDKTHWYVFFSEVLGAAILAFAFAGALRVKNDRIVRAFTYGFGILAAGLTAGVLATAVKANGVFNPAIANAAQAVEWTKIDWWTVAVFMVAPLIGAIVGFALRDVVDTNK
jgi:glycerol uptake facilitator-like aquaporin